MGARVLVGVFLVGSLVASSTVSAKALRPGDLSICNAKRCVAIESRPALEALGAFYYDTTKPPPRAGAPRLGVPFFRLEFSNGYVTGIVAGATLGRFLSYGVDLEQFRKGHWYKLPSRAVAELRTLTARLRPLRLTAAAEQLAR